ncbi:PaaI family thioesterase [Halobacteriales archaeon QS_3_64_16]|nr:MAG: PaaI family thioesterase [Halobacteriales archaeon QS_3_64_16]
MSECDYGKGDGAPAEEDLTDDALDRMGEVLDEHGYLSWLGIELEEAMRGRAVMILPYREELANAIPGSTGSLHGGIPATLIDTASGFALRTTFADPRQAALTTTDLDISYLRPATADLRVEAEVARAGGTIGVTRASITSVAPDGDRKEVAIGTTTYRLFRGGDDNEGVSESDTDVRITHTEEEGKR